MQETAWVLAHTGARAVTGSTVLQSLWGGYGELRRLTLDGPEPSAILKQVIPPTRGKLTTSDRRKLRSYEVEWAWYREPRCDDDCRIARCYAVEGSRLLLEDLRNAGFQPGSFQVRAGLRWLAHFHRRFLGSCPPGLWEQGTYWHLDTRLEEWDRMPTGPLKAHAERWDEMLRNARHQTLVHGDAKPANFCWSADGRAAAVDFQYVGPGCGIRDVAYFLDCCGAEKKIDSWLDYYFSELQAPEVEPEWRQLFPVAWSDYARFYQGWSGRSPLDEYTRQMIQQAL